MKNKNKQNPNKSTIVQALIVLSNAGFNTNILDDMIEELNENPEFCSKLQKTWDKIYYTEESLKWAQFTIYEQFFQNLSPIATKTFLILGSYASQSGLIQIQYKTLMDLGNLSDKSITRAINELKQCGCISVMRKAKGHNPPIYKVNQQIINLGKRSSKNKFGFLGNEKDYILNQKFTTDGIYDYRVIADKCIDEDVDGSKIVYNKITIDLTKEEFSNLKKESENSHKTN